MSDISILTDDPNLPESVDSVPEEWSPWKFVHRMSMETLEHIGPSDYDPDFAIPFMGSVPDAINALKKQLRVFFQQHQKRSASILSQVHAGEGMAEPSEEEKWALSRMLEGIAEFVSLHRLDDSADSAVLKTIFLVPECGPQETFRWLVDQWWPHGGQEWQMEKLARNKILGLP